MKKWYVITAVLTILLLISMGTCSINCVEVDDTEDELASVKHELADVKDDLADAQKEVSDLSQLTATKEIDFGNGLLVSGIEKDGNYVTGSIQNVSSVPMDDVRVIVAFYGDDGALEDFDTCTVRDLFPGEVMEWSVYYTPWGEPGLFDVYAIGNKSTGS